MKWLRTTLLWLSASLLLAHALVPHHHHNPNHCHNRHDVSQRRDVSFWQKVMGTELGEGHLEYFTTPKSKLDSEHHCTISLHAFAWVLRGVTSLDNCAQSSYPTVKTLVASKHLLSAGPLRAPPFVA